MPPEQYPQYPNRTPEQTEMSLPKKMSIALPLAIVIALGVVVFGALWLMNEAERMRAGGGDSAPDNTDKLQVLSTLYSDGAQMPIEEKSAILQGVSASSESNVSADEKLRLLESLKGE